MNVTRTACSGSLLICRDVPVILDAGWGFCRDSPSHWDVNASTRLRMRRKPQKRLSSEVSVSALLPGNVSVVLAVLGRRPSGGRLFSTG